MSQNPFLPPPYLPPVMDMRAWAMGQPRGPARGAAIWQLVLGGLIFLIGSCALLAVRLLPDDLMLKAVQQSQSNFTPFENMTPAQEARLALSIASGGMMIAGLLLLILTIFVRRGGKISTVCSIVFISLFAIMMLISFANALMQVAGNPQVIPSLLVIGGIFGLAAITIVKLVAAVRSSGSAQTAAMQQAYYWMMQNQQGGGLGQGGYGYGGNNSNASGPLEPGRVALPPSPPSFDIPAPPGADDRIK